MTRRLRTRPEEWPLALAAAVLLLVLPVCLRAAPRWTLRRAGRIPAARVTSGFWSIERVAGLVATVSGLPRLGGTCLSRGLAVLVLARRLGLEATLVIGVARHDRGMRAHAWLETDGRVRPPQPIEGYAPIWRSA